ncbi:MAG: hypothetical protein HIU88_12190 [Acidobacteria bacterium]|nr:hypothetical protein [Acidobacteriota bacterium]
MIQNLGAIALIALLSVLTVLAVFQVALAAGAPLGRFAWGGTHRVLPRKLRIGSAVSVAIYAVVAVVALDRGGWIDVVAEPISRVGMWILFAYFVLSIVPNLLSRSPRERAVMVPVSVLLALLSLPVALS